MTDWYDLTAFQTHVLEAIARVDAGDAQPYGLAIKRELEGLYADEVHHSRLYQNLDRLVDQDLVARGHIDDRTNAYELTDAGKRLLVERANTLSRVVAGDAGQPTAPAGEPR